MWSQSKQVQMFSYSMTAAHPVGYMASNRLHRHMSASMTRARHMKTDLVEDLMVVAKVIISLPIIVILAAYFVLKRLAGNRRMLW